MSDSLNNLPVTTIVRLKPKPGLKNETLDWFHKISDEASQFNGHLGAEIFEAISDDKHTEFVIIIQFDTYENLKIWETSKERAKQIELSKTLFEESKPKIQLTGLEYWFESSADHKAATPPKWKMAIMTVAVIFILSNILIPLLTDFFKPLRLPNLINNFFSVIIMVALMTYIVMPFTTKILSGWLFKKKRST
jgi:uncharacterized protein